MIIVQNVKKVTGGCWLAVTTFSYDLVPWWRRRDTLKSNQKNPQWRPASLCLFRCLFLLSTLPRENDRNRDRAKGDLNTLSTSATRFRLLDLKHTERPSNVLYICVTEYSRDTKYLLVAFKRDPISVDRSEIDTYLFTQPVNVWSSSRSARLYSFVYAHVPIHRLDSHQVLLIRWISKS